jgi:hypothetical protein
MARFHRYVGVHYSGRKGPGDPLPGLAVYSAQGDHAPFREYGSSDEEARFSRRELAEWLLARLMEAEPVVIGLDHAFSFPHSYMERNGLTSWHAFLDDFEGHWPTDRVAVRELLDDNPRTGAPDEYRLAGRWTAAPRGVFSWGLHQDSPAKAAHAGIPWLAYLRRAGEKVHMWPFDGWEVPEGKSVVAEVRPARFVHRYPHEELSQEDLEARATALWLQERDRLDLLTPYFTPPLSEAEKERATLEGWILGVA